MISVLLCALDALGSSAFLFVSHPATHPEWFLILAGRFSFNAVCGSPH